MSQDAKDFIDAWVQENIGSGAYDPLGDMSTPGELAELCRAEARMMGISDRQLDAAAGSVSGNGADGLTRHLADAMERRIGQAAQHAGGSSL